MITLTYAPDATLPVPIDHFTAVLQTRGGLEIKIIAPLRSACAGNEAMHWKNCITGFMAVEQIGMVL